MQRDEVATAGAAPATEGVAVAKFGIVDQDGERPGKQMEPGLNMRAGPSEASPRLRRLPHNTPLIINRELPGEWYFAVSKNDGNSGYVAKSYVNTDLPDPDASLHRIKSGETALDIVRSHFDPDAFEWGKDARFYVNVLVFVNSDKNRHGIRKPSPNADWDETMTFAGEQIWIPGRQFADTLKGQVSSGSITYEAWSRVKEVLSWIAGAGAFIGGLLVGALESLWDLVAGLAEMAWSIVKSLFTLHLIHDARALMKQLLSLSPSDLADALADWLEPRWNHKSFFKKWYWRGWIIGYAIAEVLLTIFTAGVVELAKSAARATKLVSLIKKLSAMTKITDAAKALKKSKAVVALTKAAKAVKSGRRARQVFVEIGAGDLRSSIDVARRGEGAISVIAVDPVAPEAAAVRDLEQAGGQFVQGVAEDLQPGTADHVFQYFPWRIAGTGSHIEGGTWRLIEDTIALLKPEGAAHFVTEDFETARYLAREAGNRGLKAVVTKTTAGAAAPGATGAGVPGFGRGMEAWQVNIYK